MSVNRYKSNEVLGLCVTLLRIEGAEDIQLSHRRKHLRLSWIYRGHRAWVTVPNTPSDWRSGLNTRADVKRQLRAAEMMMAK